MMWPHGRTLIIPGGGDTVVNIYIYLYFVISIDRQTDETAFAATFG